MLHFILNLFSFKLKNTDKLKLTKASKTYRVNPNFFVDLDIALKN